MTQQTTWNVSSDPTLKDWHWFVCGGQARYREDFLDEGLNTFNNQTREISRRYSIPLYDLANTIPKSREFFYDDVHFNDPGAAEAATQLAAVIAGAGLVPR